MRDRLRKINLDDLPFRGLSYSRTPACRELPHCRKKLKVLSGRSYLGFCSKCYGWLGINIRSCSDPWKSYDEYKRKQAFWKAGEIRKLLQKFPYLRISTNCFTGNLNYLIKTVAHGNINNFAYQTGIWHASVRRLLDGSLPTIEIVLKISHGLDVSPVRLFENKDNSKEAAVKTTPEISGKPINKEEMQSCLNTFLTEAPPPSANEVSRRIGWSTERLKRNFPDEYKQIVEGYSRHARQGVPKISDDAVRQILSEALTREAPPSLQSVFREIGCHNTGYRYYRLFPKLCADIAARYKAANLKAFDIPRATKIINAALKENPPPPSYSEVAERMGCTRENLKKKLPELSKSINQRYKDHTTNLRKENTKQLHETIRKVLLDLQINNSTVSMNKVRKLLPRKWNEAKFKAAYNPAHRRNEFNYGELILL